jgi:hypothetical protein
MIKKTEMLMFLNMYNGNGIYHYYTEWIDLKVSKYSIRYLVIPMEDCKLTFVQNSENYIFVNPTLIPKIDRYKSDIKFRIPVKLTKPEKVYKIALNLQPIFVELVNKIKEL